jgi:CubicO group peptidase (beta-lactamase class C family)
LPAAFTGQDEQFYRAFFILGCAIDQCACPGAALAVAHRGQLIALKGMGRFTYEIGSPRVTADAIYDLASVTKVLATTAACMVLYEHGIFKPNQPVHEILPEFAGPLEAGPPEAGPQEADARRQVTLRMLLAHSSGLPAYIKLFQTAHNKEELLRQAFQVPLMAAPGQRAEYSDIGFILLGEALERLTGEPLDRFCQREIFSPLGLSRITFCPPAEWKPLIPPTENDQAFRHRVIQGEVNDENAFVMDGVAGHAGCFSTARDVSIFAQCMLQGGTPILRPETIAIFTHREDFPPGTSHALGWDTPSQPSQAGKYFSPRSYGHLGYTGTSLWIDPDRQLSVTLLTNRTWPDRGSQSIRQLRPALHNAIFEALR